MASQRIENIRKILADQNHPLLRLTKLDNQNATPVYDILSLLTIMTQQTKNHPDEKNTL